jgi:HlyD family secretion protein
MVSRRRVLASLGGLGVASLIGLLATSALRGDQSTGVSLVRPNPGTPANADIHALARLEPASGLITVGVRPGIRVEAVKVEEGDEVRAGALLAILEGHAQAQRQLELAEAEKKNADHQRRLQRDKLALSRATEDQLKQPRHDAAEQVAKLTRQKFQELTALEKTLSPLIEKDARAKYEIAQAAFQLEVAALKAELDVKQLDAEQEARLKLRAIEDQETDDHGPAADVLARQIEIAQEALKQTEVRALSSGVVLELLARPGEVSGGALLTLGDLGAMVAKAEVYQADVGRVALGDGAEVTLQTQAVPGTVVKVGRVVAGNQLRDLDPRSLQDLRVVTVTIALKDAKEASKYVRRQVDVTIRPKSAAPR